MVTRIGGLRRKTRSLFRKSTRNKGKFSVSKYLQEFDMGDKVLLKAEPAVAKGIYFRRFHGKTGQITGKKQGECYYVQIKDGNKPKKVIVHPIHLRKV
jgi:large subunit ribosomal protein L21e